MSKAEMRQAILALSKELGVEAPANLEQIDKVDLLQPILDALQQQKLAAATTDDDGANDSTGSGPTGPGVGAPPPPPTLEEIPEEKPVIATTYVVAEGKSVTTKRGAIGALEHVWPNDFSGGQKDLDHWVAHGFVTKTDHRGDVTNSPPEPAKK